jgi:hypothetical protein
MPRNNNNKNNNKCLAMQLSALAILAVRADTSKQASVAGLQCEPDPARILQPSLLCADVPSATCKGPSSPCPCLSGTGEPTQGLGNMQAVHLKEAEQCPLVDTVLSCASALLSDPVWRVRQDAAEQLRQLARLRQYY